MTLPTPGNTAITGPSGNHSLEPNVDGSINVDEQVLSGIPNETVVSVGTGNTSVLAANASRKFLQLINDSTNTIYVSFQNNAALSTGTRLNANGGTIQFDTYVPNGAVKAIATGASSNLLVTEG